MDQYTFFILLSPFAIATASVVAFYCWRHRSSETARALAACLTSAVAYLFINDLELVTTAPDGKLFFAQVCYLCISLLTVNWMAFALAFSNREKVLKSPYFRLLWIIPALTIGLVFTNSYHHLIWKDIFFLPVNHGYLYFRVVAYGSWFWVFWFHSYFLILAGAVLIIWNSLSSQRTLPMRTRLTLAGALLPLVINLIYVLRLIPGFYKDYSPLAYAFSGILFAISIYRFQLLELPMLGRSILIDNMSDGMLTLDSAMRVADLNPAANRIFVDAAQPAPRIGVPFPLLSNYIRQFDARPQSDLLENEIVFTQAGEKVYYDLQIRRLYDPNRSEVIGYLISLHAVTEHKKLLEAARKLAMEDALTGVFNRRHFIELAHDELAQSRSKPVYFSILMIDIDFFKTVNDTLGHIGGDQVLHAFAQRLRMLLRSTDVIGRIGGDEFIVMLPDTSLDNARLLAERLCARVAEKPIETEDYGAFSITISIGVSECSTKYSKTLEPAIALADKGLFQAKDLGRNRVRIYDVALQSQR
ncbi:protein containg diguanylate cyclase (GGDEF) domain [Longilinea arvoryzae]|uniref:Protein containg diguanylate cyclase (GGDEF) domain n=1 Tax=Longilinea arvoryzae TaxID=360412 RepID=A0A0S7BEI1_9CHLR|nr:diguanylate cyclase [Longilinea arvoryzae]GAP13344.1 protein containg diguanylate cyclase (GGDEF) domain [Longilinea arvoryzae]